MWENPDGWRRIGEFLVRPVRGEPEGAGVKKKKVNLSLSCVAKNIFANVSNCETFQVRFVFVYVTKASDLFIVRRDCIVL